LSINKTELQPSLSRQASRICLQPQVPFAAYTHIRKPGPRRFSGTDIGRFDRSLLRKPGSEQKNRLGGGATFAPLDQP
jgi:hypothetical protein